MSHPIIFPQPQIQEWAGEALTLGRKGTVIPVMVESESSPPARQALSVLRATLRGAGLRARRTSRSGEARILLVVIDGTPGDESYHLDVNAAGVLVSAHSGLGLLHAAHTIRQLIRVERGSAVIPTGFVEDAPAIPCRGTFQEATYATSLMSLDDWKGLVDLHASLKMNAMMVGLYSCWRRADHDKEFLLVPSKKYPKLASPQEIPHYSPRRKRRVTQRFLPRMFAEDFLGDLIAYAAERGVTIIPYISSLGHNTLIPRLYPEVSTRDAAGNPKNSGFCTSSRKSYDLLFGLFDEIIDRYMKPHGLEMFGVGMDEVRHACECPKCRRAANHGMDNFMVRHVFRMLDFFKKRNMRRVIMWHDMIERGGYLNAAFVDALRKRGLDDLPAIAWWSYGDQRGEGELSATNAFRFTTFKPHLGLHNWAVPSAGWNSPMPLALSREGNIRSIQTHAQLALRDGAEAMSSYSVHDPIFLEGYHALAEFSWSPRASNDLREFRERYYRMLFGSEWAAGRDCMDRMERAFARWHDLFNLMFTRTYMDLHPGQGIFATMAKSENASPQPFAGSISVLDACGRELRALAQRHRPYRKTILMYAADCDFISSVLGCVLGTAEILRDYHRVRLAPTDTELVARFRAATDAYDGRIKSLKSAMAAIEKARHPANAPFILNRLTGLLDFTECFRGLAAKLARELRKGDRATLPLLSVTRYEGFFGEEVGVYAL